MRALPAAKATPKEPRAILAGPCFVCSTSSPKRGCDASARSASSSRTSDRCVIWTLVVVGAVVALIVVAVSDCEARLVLINETAFRDRKSVV